MTAFETIMQATVITVPMTLSVLNLTAKACGLVLLARLVLAHLYSFVYLGNKGFE
jgi:hypothetical protein